WLTLVPGALAVPVCIGSHDEEFVVDQARARNLVVREEDFMDFLTNPPPYCLEASLRRDRLCQVGDPHARHFGHKYLSSLHHLNASDHETNTLLERHHESGHRGISDCQGAQGPLPKKER